MKVPPSILGDHVTRKNHLYAIWARGSKQDDDEEGCKLLLISLVVISSF